MITINIATFSAHIYTQAEAFIPTFHVLRLLDAYLFSEI